MSFQSEQRMPKNGRRVRDFWLDVPILPPVFLQTVRNLLNLQKISCAPMQKSERRVRKSLKTKGALIAHLHKS